MGYIGSGNDLARKTVQSRPLAGEEGCSRFLARNNKVSFSEPAGRIMGQEAEKMRPFLGPPERKVQKVRIEL
jgi:hypothetical protein